MGGKGEEEVEVIMGGQGGVLQTDPKGLTVDLKSSCQMQD